MSIYLGDLDLKDVCQEDSYQVIQQVFDDVGIKHYHLADMRNAKEGDYHIFDIPRMLVIKGNDITDKLISELKKKGLVSSFKGQIQIGVSQNKEEE